MSKLFGDNLKKERKKQGKTVQNVADSCKTSRSYITLIENNMRLPSKKVIPQIALSLGLKTTTVLNWYLESISHKFRKHFMD